MAMSRAMGHGICVDRLCDVRPVTPVEFANGLTGIFNDFQQVVYFPGKGECFLF